MKKHLLYISLAIVIAIFSFIFSQDALARFFWEKLHNPKLAVLLLRSDEKLAMDIGNYYFNGGAYDLAVALKAYKKALAIDSQVRFGNYELARIYFVEGKYDEAIKALERELKNNYESFRSYYVRGLVYGYRGDFDKAEADFRVFVKWAPREWGGYNDLAWILNREVKYKEAKEVIKTAFVNVEQGEENPWLLNSLGVAELNLGEYQAAEDSFREAEKFARILTMADWQMAYPGNSPANAGEGLAAFRLAIKDNLEKSQVKQKEND